MTEQPPKSHGRKVINPLDSTNGIAPELSLDFSRPPTHTSRAMEEMPGPEDGEFSSEEPLQALQQMTSIKYRKVENVNRRLHIWIGILLMGMALIAFIVGLPYFLLKTDPAINQGAKQSIRFVQKNLDKHGLGGYTKQYSEQLLLQLTILYGPGTEKSANREWRDMDCKFLIQEALSRRFRGHLDTNGQYLLTNCQLSQDMPIAALRQVIEIYGDAEQFQRNGDSWEMIPLQLLVGEAQKRTQTLQLTAPKNFPGCRRWNSSPSCFLKFVDQARQPVRNRLDEGYAILKTAVKGQAKVLQVWLAVAAAWNAIKLGDGALVEQHLKEAAGFFPELFDPLLEREVFRLRLANAMRLHDKKLFGAIWKGRPALLMAEDEAGFLDTQLYRALILKPEKAGLALDDFFARAESFQRFRFDPRFIRMVVEYSIRNQRSQIALNYVDHILEMQEEDKNPDSDWLPLLKARLLLANGKGLEVLQTLQPVEKFAVKSQELAHLKGAAMLIAYSTRPYMLLAASEFQRAANLDPRSEHFFALILAFLETKEIKKAEASLKFWQRLKARGNDESWRNLAQGLILYSQGNDAAAQQLWNDLAARNPGFEPVKRLLTNLAEDQKYLQDQLVRKFIPMLPVDGPLGPLVVF